MTAAVAGRAALAQHAPEAVAALEDVERVAAATVDAATRELVRRRVAALLGLEAPDPADSALPADQLSDLDDWHRSPAFDEPTRAVLAFVEQFVFSVGSMGDEEVAALLADRTPLEVHELCNVVWSVELAARADHVAAQVLA